MLREVNKEPAVRIGNKYTGIPSFKTGIEYFLYYSDSSRFFPSAGLFITSKGARNNLPDGMVWNGTDKPYMVEKFFSADIPIILNYRFENWLILKGGVHTSFIFATSGFQKITEKKVVTIGLTGGATLLIRRFSLSVEYVYDLSDMLKYHTLDISYRCSLAHLGIGYYF